jgi:alpha-beta hydrolase superfamily lysophospholipase
MADRGDVAGEDVWLDDVERYVQLLDARLPTFLAGISWGGKLVPALARRGRITPAGVIMIGPGLYARQQPGPMKRLALRAAVTLGAARRRVAIPLADPRLFTDTPPWRDYIRDDPLTLRRVTLRFALADLRMNQYARAAAEHIRCPTLLMLAGRDRIVDNRRTLGFFDRITVADKTCHEYPDAGHTLEFEPDPSRYLDDLSSWLAQRSIR